MIFTCRYTYHCNTTVHIHEEEYEVEVTVIIWVREGVVVQLPIKLVGVESASVGREAGTGGVLRHHSGQKQQQEGEQKQHQQFGICCIQLYVNV